MDQRASYLLQILETIGAPLMEAIVDAAPAQSSDAQADAQAMAGLLGKTVEASIELGNIMDINPAEAQDDTLRVALAGLAGPLIAGQYARRGAVPESADIKKITGALQAVLTFSDNFTPTPETVERLKNLDAQGQSVDAYQTNIQYMQAFIPVTEAIAAFPFGQAETKLIMDVSDKIVKKSVELRETMMPNIGDEAAQKRVELGLVKGMASLYAACHRAETQKAMQQPQGDAPQALSIDPVWDAFNTRLAMLEALAAKMAPGDAPPAAMPSTPPATPATPVTTQTAEAPPPSIPATETPPAQPPPATPATPPPAAPPAGANPMAMFAKKPSGDTSGPAAETPPAAPPPTTPPATPNAAPPPVQTAPPAQPPQQPPATPEQPPAAPPTESQSDESGDGDGNSGQTGGQSGNPMSFFKKGED